MGILSTVVAIASAAVSTAIASSSRSSSSNSSSSGSSSGSSSSGNAFKNLVTSVKAAFNKTNAVVVQNGVQLTGAYVKNGVTYDKNGKKLTGNFSTQINGKVFVHTDDGNGGYSEQIAQNVSSGFLRAIQNGKVVPGAYISNGRTYDANGNQLTGSFTAIVGNKVYHSGKGGTGDYEQACASNPDAPSNLSQIPKNKIAYGKAYVDGELRENMPFYDGVVYDPDTGLPMTDMHTGEGVLDSTEYTKYYEIGEDGKPTAYFTKKPKKLGYIDLPDNPIDLDPYTTDLPPSVPPPKLIFDEPFPTFSANLKKVTKYNYYFGLDLVEAKKAGVEQNSCWISQLIYVGDFKDNEYLQLDIDYYQDENSNIEFYIIDGEKEIPIVPIKDSSIANESLFLGLDTRFLINHSEEIIIKNKGVVCNKSYQQIIQEIGLWENTENRYEYTISYTPTEGSWKYKPINTEISVKAIVRYYDTAEYSPYIRSISLRKYIQQGLYE